MRRKASSSMSKRAPKAVDESVRRATQPSTPSRTRAAVDNPMVHHAPAIPPTPGTNTSAATGKTRAARARVTRLGGPRPDRWSRGGGRSPGKDLRISRAWAAYSATTHAA
jgi:hypothetical protein